MMIFCSATTSTSLYVIAVPVNLSSFGDWMPGSLGQGRQAGRQAGR